MQTPLLLSDYVRIVRRRWIVLVLALIAGIALAAAYSLVTPAVYKATAKSYVSTVPTGNVLDANQGALYAQQVVASYADLAGTQYVLDPVIDQLGLDTTADRLADDVDISTSSNSAVLEVTVADRSPRGAAVIANAINERLSEAVQRLTTDAKSGQLVRVTPVQRALPPEGRSSPNLPVNLVLGAVAGVVLAAAAIFLLAAADTSLRDVQTLKQVSPRPVIGMVPVARAKKGRGRTGTVQPDPEAFTFLRANLQFMSVDVTNRVLLVTSSVPEEGKSTVALQLAASLAEGGDRVLLVDADLRRPSIAAYAGLDGAIGLSEVLAGRYDVETAVQHSAAHRIDVLPSGPVPPDPAELLQSKRMQHLVEEARDRYDWVVLDTPPVLPVADALLLAHLSDGALVVAGLDRLRRPQLLEALDRLQKVGASVPGVVANRVRTARGGAGVYPSAAYASDVQPAERAGAVPPAAV